MLKGAEWCNDQSETLRQFEVGHVSANELDSLSDFVCVDRSLGLRSRTHGFGQFETNNVVTGGRELPGYTAGSTTKL